MPAELLRADNVLPQLRASVTGGRVGLRPGCLGVLRHANAAGVPTHVISVNWSSELVRAALQQPSADQIGDSNSNSCGRSEGALKSRSG